MATRKPVQQNRNQFAVGRGNNSGRGVFGSTDVGYPAAQGESVVVALGLIVCLLLLVGFMTVTVFLYADLQAARGANKIIERKIKTVIERCDKE